MWGKNDEAGPSPDKSTRNGERRRTAGGCEGQTGDNGRDEADGYPRQMSKLF